METPDMNAMRGILKSHVLAFAHCVKSDELNAPCVVDAHDVRRRPIEDVELESVAGSGRPLWSEEMREKPSATCTTMSVGAIPCRKK